MLFLHFSNFELVNLTPRPRQFVKVAIGKTSVLGGEGLRVSRLKIPQLENPWALSHPCELIMGQLFQFRWKNAKSTRKNGFNLNNNMTKGPDQKGLTARCWWVYRSPHWGVTVTRFISHSQHALKASRLPLPISFSGIISTRAFVIFSQFQSVFFFLCDFSSPLMENKINDLKVDFSFRILAGTCLAQFTSPLPFGHLELSLWLTEVE